MIKIALVDDNAAERENLSLMFRRLNEEIHQTLEIEAYSCGQDLLDHFDDSFSMLCLDIELAKEDPVSDGLTLARQIRKTGSKVMIIFITNLMQLAIRGYEVRAFDFIVKPLSYADFSMKMRTALGFLMERQSVNLQLLTPQGFQLISSDALVYVEVSGHYVFYHTTDSVYKMKGSMKETEDRVQGLSFKRCNSCFLVNLKHVEGVDRDDVIVTGGEKLRMSRPKKREFLQAVSEYIGGRVI